jgi:hypothetical protein
MMPTPAELKEAVELRFSPTVALRLGRKTMSNYLVSKMKVRQGLVRQELLRASVAVNYDAALRWYKACQSLAVPGRGDGRPALGEIVGDVMSVPEGQKRLVRWHDGTITVTWIPGPLLAERGQVTWIVAATRWNDSSPGPWLGERVMRVEVLLDALPVSIINECERYWRDNRELFDMELQEFLIDNEGER